MSKLIQRRFHYREKNPVPSVSYESHPFLYKVKDRRRVQKPLESQNQASSLPQSSTDDLNGPDFTSLLQSVHDVTQPQRPESRGLSEKAKVYQQSNKPHLVQNNFFSELEISGLVRIAPRIPIRVSSQDFWTPTHLSHTNRLGSGSFHPPPAHQNVLPVSSTDVRDRQKFSPSSGSPDVPGMVESVYKYIHTHIHICVYVCMCVCSKGAIFTWNFSISIS